MPSVTISVPHTLEANEAQRRIAHLITESKAKFSDSVTNVEESWTGNHGTFSFKAMGFNVSGNMEVESDSASVEINFPFAALPFKGRIENEITGRLKTLLA